MNTEKLDYLLQRIEDYIENHEVLKTDISKASVGWHIDHSLKVVNNVVGALQKSDPETYKNNFSLMGKIFFALGFFPRGKAKAPKHVKPPEVILKEDLISQIEVAKNNINVISELNKNAYFKHPLFGNVNRKRVTRFLVLHTNHHVKIINEITS
ncbi:MULTISPECIES: DUF1569 domain-containing protein [Tenacibaculum]|uniref:DUF1569 domain-containing protein n=1 Tax=Tenacibaculum TaxID=104267 RepID=UPI001F0A6EFC|nr:MULTISPECIES: DUF1569 domain-containing protein [Tenacibaculum]MCH3881742.1 DUF1569 domain-containing protein [Tenacibaculum aquimarinum]MDO6598690.1 DUF1569 domain-containing protein [Tenacibaculum sp. 1_MG-2023]